jgi:biopolymer transport protein ExbD
MKRFSERSGYATMSELNVTPMLDLAFVLLIIFIITTPLMENSLEINLPTATPTDVLPKEPPLVKTVEVSAKGLIYFDNKKVSAAQLEKELLKLKSQDQNLAVIVRADKEIKYQILIDVFDALQQAKVTKMGLTHADEKER